MSRGILRARHARSMLAVGKLFVHDIFAEHSLERIQLVATNVLQSIRTRYR